MTQEPFSVAVAHRGSTVVVSVTGSLDHHTAHRLRPEALGLPRRWQVLVVDLSGVDFMDSAGVGAIAALYRMARRRQRPFALLNPRREPRTALELSRLNLVVPIYESVEEVERAVRDGSFA